MAHVGCELIVLDDATILLLVVGHDGKVAVEDTFGPMDGLAVAEVGTAFLGDNIGRYTQRDPPVHGSDTISAFGGALLVDDLVAEKSGWSCRGMGNQRFLIRKGEM